MEGGGVALVQEQESTSGFISIRTLIVLLRLPLGLRAKGLGGWMRWGGGGSFEGRGVLNIFPFALPLFF